jgi:DNA-binding SARP family transcriptional activator
MTGSPNFGPDHAIAATVAAPVLLRLTVFGSMSATDVAGRSVLPKSRKARGVLAVLALQASRPVLRSELADLLWSRRDREQARASLRQAVHELTDLLGPIDPRLLRVDRNHLSLASDLIWVDARAIVAAVASQSEMRDLFRTSLLEDLIGLDPAFDRWRAAQMERLTRLVRARAEEALEASRGYPAEVDAAERLLRVDRAHEGAWRVLIGAHVARDDRAAAIAAFERSADATADVAQLTPSAETEALLSTIRETSAQIVPISPVAAVAESLYLRDETRKDRLRIGGMPLRVRGSGREDEVSLGVTKEIAIARDLLFGAIPAVYRLDNEGFRAAGEMLAAAIALDPNYAAAHAWYSYWHLFLVRQGWAADRSGAIGRGAELAERAVVLDPSDARALTMAGYMRSFLCRRADEGLELHERAIALNPNLALAWCFSGLSLSYLGRHEEAIARAEQARLLSPFDPHVFFFDMAAMLPRLILRQHEIVVEISNRAVTLNPGFSPTYKWLLAAHGHLGNTGDAASARQHLLALEPDFTVRSAIARSALTRQADIDHYAEGLRRAGLPE